MSLLGIPFEVSVEMKVDEHGEDRTDRSHIEVVQGEAVTDIMACWYDLLHGLYEGVVEKLALDTGDGRRHRRAHSSL